MVPVLQGGVKHAVGTRGDGTHKKAVKMNVCIRVVQPMHDSLQARVLQQGLSDNQITSNGQLKATHWLLDEIAQALFSNLNKTCDKRLL